MENRGKQGLKTGVENRGGLPKRGDIITLNESWAALGFKMTESMRKAPPNIVKLIWGAALKNHSVVDHYAPVSSFRN